MIENKRGQMVGLGAFLTLFIGVLVGLVLLPATAVFTGQATNTAVTGNETITAPAANVTIDITGQSLLSDVLVWNATEDAVAITSANYSVQEGISTTSGLKTVQFTSLDGGDVAGNSINISYTYGPDGYIDSAGARSITGLIILFFALSIAIIAMSPVMRNGLFDLVGK